MNDGLQFADLAYEQQSPPHPEAGILAFAGNGIFGDILDSWHL